MIILQPVKDFVMMDSIKIILTTNADHALQIVKLALDLIL